MFAQALGLLDASRKRPSGTVVRRTMKKAAKKRRLMGCEIPKVAEACLHLLENYDGASQVNVGTGRDVTIRELAEVAARVVGYEGESEWDFTKPDGTPQKLLDISRLRASGWEANIGLDEGVTRTVAWSRQHADSLRV